MELVSRSKTDLSSCQEIILSTGSTLKSLGLPPLGPAFAGMSGLPLHEALVVHRFTSKLEKPDNAKGDSRRKASIESMLRNDASLSNLLVSHLSIDRSNIKILGDRLVMPFTKAKLFLERALGDFKPSYQAIFPSGETYVSAKGEVSLAAKLASPDQWTVSVDCIDYAANICYHNVALRRLVRARFRETALNWKVQAREWWLACGNPFHVFKRMFAWCCEIVGVSRLTTVPKNNASDRTITCEPFWNMVSQLSFARDLRRFMLRKLGIHLESLQELHKSLLSSGKSTIDFSAASDTNLWCVVQQLFPKRVVCFLKRLRTGIVEYRNEEDELTFVPLNMFAPMGTGCTFEVMTLTLLAYARSFDSGASVYGDDVMLSTEAAPAFIDFVSTLGWKVNTQKSFIKGNFRESCGGFYDLKTRKSLLSYDMWYPTDIPSLMVCVGKIRRLIDALAHGRVRNILLHCYAQIHRKVARVYLLPDTERFNADLSLDGFPSPFYRAPSYTVTGPPVVLILQQMWQRPVWNTSYVTYAPKFGSPKGLNRREVGIAVLLKTMSSPKWESRGVDVRTVTRESYSKAAVTKQLLVSFV